MAETRYEDLSADDRRDALEVVERGSSHKAHLLEKDIWVVATLDALFDGPFAQHLTFKGGTSLSKVWRAIQRFSEDVDITYDIRAFAPDLVSGANEEALPPTRSQEKRWSRLIRARLAEWVRDQAHPVVEDGLARAGFSAAIRVEADRLYIGYEPLFEETGLVRPEVMVEFGARSTGKPHKIHPVVCDAAAHLPDLAFPEASPAVMLAERTFWEKATAIHVFCRQERRRGERLSRHWHDLARLDETGAAAHALADRLLALSVARHKAMFFSENDVTGSRIDYEAAVSGDLQLVPAGAAHAVLADDYARMLADGMLLDDTETFDALMERCAAIEARANAAGSRSR
ncbi:MAG: nucleotidyl transferase AbiEii/AbiGii toxin family protein [Bryobacterales bacterium]|nr:nucleotidyl transferase AbiEii/AbiGii toxin family protein [Bryobacterales bacterium]